MHIREVFLIAALVGVDSVTIKWDNKVPVEYNFFDQGRSNDQVRVPNWLLIYPGYVIVVKSKSKYCKYIYFLFEHESVHNCENGKTAVYRYGEETNIGDAPKWYVHKHHSRLRWKIGTKWCGAGNVAENENDLGDFWKTDKCCRNHDLCDSYIRGYQTNYNLTNNSFYTRLHCNCDQMFRDCLKSVDTLDSKTIGGIYFNALGTQCFKEEHPVVKCTKHIYFPRKKCVSYELDTAKDPIYQWFDVPSF